MRSKTFIQMIIVALVATATFTGCKNMPWNKKKPGTPGGGDTGTTGGGPFGGGSGIGVSERPLAGGEWRRGQFDVVYFEYDSSKVRPSEVSKLEAVATYLKAHPGKLVVEGNADERGTAEYNRALSERRALACRDELVRLGVAADRLTTIGYGKEKPAVTGHDDTAWAKNRRCEFVLPGQ